MRGYGTFSAGIKSGHGYKEDKPNEKTDSVPGIAAFIGIDLHERDGGHCVLQLLQKERSRH